MKNKYLLPFFVSACHVKQLTVSPSVLSILSVIRDKPGTLLFPIAFLGQCHRTHFLALKV